MAEELEFSQHKFLAELGIEAENLGVFNGDKWVGSGPVITTYNPSTGRPIARVKGATAEEYETCMTNMLAAMADWQTTPAPKRGEIVRQIGEEVRKYKVQLGSLISLEMGKIIGEGIGEVQEFIDICDYATGISRTIAGQVLPSERANHTLLEVWNPLGVVGIITAFNFPMAVLSWNAAISLICGNVNIWKGASSTSLCTLAITKIIERVFRNNKINPAVCTTVIGSGATIGERLIQDSRISLVSFTGSTSIGRGIATTVHTRFGTTILELGGNNALIVMDDANLDLVIPAAFFGAIGTAGQRCTSTRRLLVHEKVYDEVVARMLKAYGQIRLGNPLDSNTLCGPLHTKAAVKEFTEGIETIKSQGGKILVGGTAVEGPGNFVNPTLVAINHDAAIVRDELFVPITYVIKFSTLEEAIAINNEVPQGHGHPGGAVLANLQMADAFFSGKDNDDAAKKEEERLLRTMNTGGRSGKFGGVMRSHQSASAPAAQAPAPAVHTAPVSHAAPVAHVVVDRSPPPAATPAPAASYTPTQSSESEAAALSREEARMAAHAGKTSVFSGGAAHPQTVHVAPVPASSSLFTRAAHNADDHAPVQPPQHSPVAQAGTFSDDSAADMARREEERIRKQFGAGALPRPGEKTAAPGQGSQSAPKPAVPSDPTKPVHAPSVHTAAPVAGASAATDSAFERELLAELNQARQQPRQYAAVVREYARAFQGLGLRLPNTNVVVQTKEGESAFTEAANELDRHAPVSGALRQSAAFSRSALDLVADHGPAGRTGDVLSDGTGAAQRLVRYGTWKKRAIETVAYLPGSARDVVVLWLADDGTADRANRKTLLDGGYSVVGIASGPHASGGRIVVVDWAEDFAEGSQAHAPQHPPQAEKSFATSTVVESPKQQAVLAELPDGSGFELDAGALGARASLSVVLRNGTELVVSRANQAQFRFELPFAYTPERVTARMDSNEHLIVKLHKPRESNNSGEVALSQFRMVPKSMSERVQIDIKETHSHLLLTTLPSKWDEQVTVKLRDGKVLLWETKHNVEDEEGLKSVTATQSLKLPFEVSPAAVQITVLANDAGAVTQLVKPLVGTVGDVTVPIN